MFQNDFVADRDKRLEYVTGYTGINGLAVVTKSKLGFWIDELHYEQADNELSCNWTLFKTDTNTVCNVPILNFIPVPQILAVYSIGYLTI